MVMISAPRRQEDAKDRNSQGEDALGRNSKKKAPFGTLLSIATLKMRRYFTPSQDSIFLNQPNK